MVFAAVATSRRGQLGVRVGHRAEVVGDGQQKLPRLALPTLRRAEHGE